MSAPAIYPCKICALERGPGQPDGYPDDHLCVRCSEIIEATPDWPADDGAVDESVSASRTPSDTRDIDNQGVAPHIPSAPRQLSLQTYCNCCEDRWGG